VPPTVITSDDGAHVQTFVGQEEGVSAIVFGPNAKGFSGSRGGAIGVWSNGVLLRTLRYELSNRALALGHDGTLYSGCEGHNRVRVCLEMW
jgi:hypothetical protein